MSAIDNSNPKDRLGMLKASLRFVPNVARIFMGLAFAEGEAKYGAFNWRKRKVKRSVYLEAIDRHSIALAAGEDIDPDSGLPHEAKIMACCAILLDAKATNCLIDDRYEGDTSAALLTALQSADYHKVAKKLAKVPARTLDEVRADETRARAKASRKRRRAA